jgi:hypothetical protein
VGVVLVVAAVAGSLVFGLESAATKSKSITLSKAGTYAAGPIEDVFDEGAAEIPAYDPQTKRAFVVNGFDDVVDVIDISDPAQPSEVGELDVSSFGSPNSVAVSGGVVAVASTAVVVEDGENEDDPTKPGTVAFFDADGNALRAPIVVGATPDMVTFTPDGDWLLVANEAEPNSYGEPDSVDPEGSISVIDMRSGVAAATTRTAGFGAFEAKKAALQQAGVRIFGPGATVSQDLEPEYIAVATNSKTAWVTIQEANAVAELDVVRAAVTSIRPLGTKDHSVAGNGLDASDQDGPAIATRSVRGMYMPDAIVAFQLRGKTFLVTANEGDVREWDGIKGPGTTTELARAGSLGALLDAPLPPGLARLNVTTAPGRAGGDTDGNGKIDVLQSFGARSISVWSTSLNRLADTGDQLEQVTKAAPGVAFNASNTNNTVDNRSDDKGPEPEGIALGQVAGTWYAFVALERVGGVAVYDLSAPSEPAFVEYVSGRGYTQPVASGLAGDLGPEGLVFVSGDDSPTGGPLLVVANEISGTTTIYEVERT